MAWIRRGAGTTAIAVTVLSVGVLCAGMAALAQQDAIKARQAAMKANGQALKSIDRIIRAGGNPTDVIGPADRIAAIAAQIPSLFQAGGNGGKTEADPAIWRKFDDFSAKAANLQNQARMLAAAAETGDLAIVRAQFDKMVQGCGDCHQSYRHRS